MEVMHGFSAIGTVKVGVETIIEIAGVRVKKWIDGVKLSAVVRK